MIDYVLETETATDTEMIRTEENFIETVTEKNSKN